MGLRNLSAWSIRNPIIPIVVFIGLLVAGIVSFMRMDVNNMPDVEFPGVIVSVSQQWRCRPCDVVRRTYQRIRFTRAMCTSRGLCMWRHVCWTAYEISGQVTVRYCRPPVRLQ